MSRDGISDSFVSTMDAKKSTNEFNYIMEQENEFYIRARRNKLLGNWAAYKLGLNSREIPRYVSAIIDIDLSSHTTNSSVIEKVVTDLKGVGVYFTLEEMQSLLGDFEKQARLERIPGHPLACEPRES
jgi:hypothetical protein